MQCWFMQGDIKLNPLSFEKDHYNRSCGDLCNVTLGVEWQFWYGDIEYWFKIESIQLFEGPLGENAADLWKHLYKIEAIQAWQ